MRCPLLLVLLCACASPSRGLRSESDFVDATAREYEASFDEVYDAAWLALQKLGLTVVAHDRREGTFTAGPKDGVGLDVQATPRQLKVRLQLSLRNFKAGQPVLTDATASGTDLDRVAALHAQVKALTEAWKREPELDYAPVSHAVSPDGMRLPLPASWNAVEVRTDRRRLKAQLFKRAQEGTNPTLLVEVDRRRPDTVALSQMVQEAMALTVPDGRLRTEAPFNADFGAYLGEFEVHADPFDLDVFTFSTETFAWNLRAAAVCPRPATPENLPDAPCVAAVKRAFGAAKRVVRE